MTHQNLKIFMFNLIKMKLCKLVWCDNDCLFGRIIEQIILSTFSFIYFDRNNHHHSLTEITTIIKSEFRNLSLKRILPFFHKIQIVNCLNCITLKIEN
jgi:hypothetical protein